MPDFLILTSTLKWVACFTYDEALKMRDKILSNDKHVEYVKIIKIEKDLGTFYKSIDK